jgi:hypothetical protein
VTTSGAMSFSYIEMTFFKLNREYRKRKQKGSKMQRVQNYLLTFHSKWITKDKSWGEKFEGNLLTTRFIYKMYRVITGFVEFSV